MFDLDAETGSILDEHTLFVLAGAHGMEVKELRLIAERPTKRAQGAPCPECLEHFDQRSGGKLRTFCSKKCRVKHNNRRAPPFRPTTCPCGAALKINTKEKPRKWCSEKCRRKP